MQLTAILTVDMDEESKGDAHFVENGKHVISANGKIEGYKKRNIINRAALNVGSGIENTDSTTDKPLRMPYRLTITGIVTKSKSNWSI